MRIRNFIWVAVSLVGAAIVFDLVRQTSSGALSAKPVADDAIPVATEKVRREDVPVYLNGLGKVQALNTVTIRAQVDGKIVQVISVKARTSGPGIYYCRLILGHIRQC